MRRFILTIFIALVLSPGANASERLQYGSAALKAEEIVYNSDLVRAAIITHRNKYYQQGKIKSQREAHDYTIKTAGIDRSQAVRNPLNCFNSLAPDFCWYTGPAQVSNTQPVADPASENFRVSAPANEEVCSTADQPCDNLYYQTEVQVNVAAGENPARKKKTVSAGSKVKLDFFSISLIF